MTVREIAILEDALWMQRLLLKKKSAKLKRIGFPAKPKLREIEDALQTNQRLSRKLIGIKPSDLRR
tara:strand:+ start:438 stop:635 length:198 start_codon:yes stop_codon:yes gene_type:complete